LHRNHISLCTKRKNLHKYYICLHFYKKSLHWYNIWMSNKNFFKVDIEIKIGINVLHHHTHFYTYSFFISFSVLSYQNINTLLCNLRKLYLLLFSMSLFHFNWKFFILLFCHINFYSLVSIINIYNIYSDK